MEIKFVNDWGGGNGYIDMGALDYKFFAFKKRGVPFRRLFFINCLSAIDSPSKVEGHCKNLFGFLFIVGAIFVVI